jgi:ferredoxin-type protein NapH
MKKMYSYNFIIRIVFLLLTPTLFRALNIAFIWHSIYFGAITFVVIIWGISILIAPIFGRIGCGWICFIGTIQDLTSTRSLIKLKWNKPILWVRVLFILGFFISSITFFFININSGLIKNIQFAPWFLNMDFNLHYKHIWIYDSFGAVLLGLLLERRWLCRNACFMGAFCAAGASFSRLIPVVDTKTCNLCGKCETDCLVRIPIKDYIINKQGLITNSDCIMCGKCVDSCNRNALKIKFVWNRKKFRMKNATSL